MPATIPMDQLGAELRRFRDEQNLSLRDVEAKTGISASTLSRIERGHIPDWRKVRILGDLLGVNVPAAGDADSTMESAEDVKRALEVHLRARKDLSEDVARAVRDLVEALLASARSEGSGEEPDG